MDLNRAPRLSRLPRQTPDKQGRRVCPRHSISHPGTHAIRTQQRGMRMQNGSPRTGRRESQRHGWVREQQSRSEKKREGEAACHKRMAQAKVSQLAMKHSQRCQKHPILWHAEASFSTLAKPRPCSSLGPGLSVCLVSRSD